MQLREICKFWFLPKNVIDVEAFLNGQEQPKRGMPAVEQEKKRKQYCERYLRFNQDAVAKRNARIAKREKRDLEIINLYTKELKTLQEIGDIYGISRERIRQRLKANNLIGCDGGSAIKTAINRSHEARNKTIPTRELQCLEYFGCSREFRDAYGKTNEKKILTCAFLIQKNSARTRRIGFELTFPQWIDIWEKSGHLHERGIGSGKYVMARVCDIGAYAIDNVEIKTHNENSKESRAMDSVRGRFNDSLWHQNKDELIAKGVKYGTFQARIKNGWSLHDAINKPINNTKRQEGDHNDDSWNQRFINADMV